MLCKDSTFRCPFQNELNEKPRQSLTWRGFQRFEALFLTIGRTRLVVFQRFRHPLLYVGNPLFIRRVVAQEDRRF